MLYRLMSDGTALPVEEIERVVSAVTRLAARDPQLYRQFLNLCLSDTTQAIAGGPAFRGLLGRGLIFQNGEPSLLVKAVTARAVMVNEEGTSRILSTDEVLAKGVEAELPVALTFWLRSMPNSHGMPGGVLSRETELRRVATAIDKFGAILGLKLSEFPRHRLSRPALRRGLIVCFDDCGNLREIKTRWGRWQHLPKRRLEATAIQELSRKLELVLINPGAIANSRRARTGAGVSRLPGPSYALTSDGNLEIPFPMSGNGDVMERSIDQFFDAVLGRTGAVA